MLPKGKFKKPKKTEKRELRSSGKAVTKATGTVPTTTLLIFKQEYNRDAAPITLLEQQ